MSEFWPTLIGCLVAGNGGMLFGALLASSGRRESERRLEIAVEALTKIRARRCSGGCVSYELLCTQALDRITE